jgi:pumilio RNA-binding family
MQKFFEFCNPEERLKLLSEFYGKFTILCQDQYGNYVLQNLLQIQGGEELKQVFVELKGKIFDMSIHKFASNVIEKCLSHGTDEQRNDMIEQIISKDDLTHDSLLAMVKDKFGNYVVQKIIENASEEMKENIIGRIINSQSLKKRDGFSKHVISFIEKMGFSAGNLNLQK